MTAAGGAVWAFERGRVLRIDPVRDRVVKVISIPGAVPGLVLEGRGGVWAGTSQALRRIDLRHRHDILEAGARGRHVRVTALRRRSTRASASE